MPENTQHHREPVTILCEGDCSDTSSHAALRRKLRAEGFRETAIRERLTEKLVYSRHDYTRETVHTEIRGELRQKYEIRTVYYRCAGCGHERVYGQEELHKESTMERRAREKLAKGAKEQRIGWAVPKEPGRRRYFSSHLKESA